MYLFIKSVQTRNLYDKHSRDKLKKEKNRIFRSNKKFKHLQHLLKSFEHKRALISRQK